MKFLHGELPMPSPQGIMNTIASFSNIMRDGNIHHNSLAMPSHQPNLDAREALQTRQDNFRQTISRDIGIVSPASLTNELNHICRNEENLCAILITPPDKSMLLCFSNEQNTIALFDSHQFAMVVMVDLLPGCKENNFYSLPFGQAEANIY